MIKVKIIKIQDMGYACANPSCKHNPEYHYNIIGEVWHMKVGTVAADINSDYFCRDCIDDIYRMIKSKLDTKLWAFH